VGLTLKDHFLPDDQRKNIFFGGDNDENNDGVRNSAGGDQDGPGREGA